MKAGYKTSEFWITTIVAIVGLLVATRVIPAPHDIQGDATWVVGAITGLYAIGRSIVKIGEKIITGK
jgi:hypothetical protein